MMKLYNTLLKEDLTFLKLFLSEDEITIKSPTRVTLKSYFSP